MVPAAAQLELHQSLSQWDNTVLLEAECAACQAAWQAVPPVPVAHHHHVASFAAVRH
jgi:hypothetical protein